MQLFHLILILVVGKTSALFLGPECDVMAKGSAAFCTYFKNHLHQAGGNLAKFACGCFAGVVIKKEDQCPKYDYYFDEAPACVELVRSGTYDAFMANDGLRNLINLMFDTILGVCGNDKDSIQRSIAGVFESGLVVFGIELAISTQLPTEQAVQLKSCYKEVRELIAV